MFLTNKKIMALVLTIVVFTSVLNFSLDGYNSNIKIHNINNYNECYIEQEILNRIEDKTGNDSNNLQLCRSNNKIISNYFNKYIIGNVNNITNNYKLKYTDVINEIFSVYNVSVFVVIFIHKADGKKRSLI